MVSFGFALSFFANHHITSKKFDVCCHDAMLLYIVLLVHISVFMYNGMHNMGKMKHKNDNIITQFGEKEHPSPAQKGKSRESLLSVCLSLTLSDYVTHFYHFFSPKKERKEKPPLYFSLLCCQHYFIHEKTDYIFFLLLLNKSILHAFFWCLWWKGDNSHVHLLHTNNIFIVTFIAFLSFPIYHHNPFP